MGKSIFFRLIAVIDDLMLVYHRVFDRHMVAVMLSENDGEGSGDNRCCDSAKIEHNDAATHSKAVNHDEFLESHQK